MSSGDRDLQRKMRRTLQLTIQGDFGLTEGEAWWCDGAELTFWCPEALVPGHLHAVRVDLLQVGATIDVKARISEVYDRREARIRHGALHVALYETSRPQDRAALDKLLADINPEVAEQHSRSASSATGSATTSRAAKAKSRIAANRARRRKAASHMPSPGDRLELTPKATATAADEAPESVASASSSARSRSESSRRTAQAPEPVIAPPVTAPPPPPVVQARPPAPPPPPVVQAPPPEPEPTPEPVPAPDPPPSAVAPEPARERRPRPRTDRATREERESRHKARMASLGQTGPAPRSRAATRDRKESSGAGWRRRDEPSTPPSASAGPPTRTPPTPPAKPRTTSDFIRNQRRRTDSVSEVTDASAPPGPEARPARDRMPDSQQAPTGAAMVPVLGLLSPGDPPSVFVRFSRADEVRGAVHGDGPRPRCLIQGLSGLTSGGRLAVAFQLPNMVFLQMTGRVLAIDGDRATLELSSGSPEDMTSLLRARS